MRVKICGLTRRQDVNTALNEGADAVGFVVESPASPRNLTLSKAEDLLSHVGVFATTVAVTSASHPKQLFAICERLKTNALQLHHYTPGIVRQLRSAYPSTKLILATPVQNPSLLAAARESCLHSDAVLADTPNPTGMGGTGKTHDWRLTRRIRNAIYPHPLILAGGLTPSNVSRAIEEVKPFAVDVSSGVEKTVGVKDPRKIKEFIMNAKEADS